MVDIFFDKLYRYPRINECVSIAVPFAKGELYNTDNISIVQNKRKCIIQPKVTAEYDDGSIKYLFVDFMADLPANKSAKAVLTTTKQELANLIADGQSECANQDGTISVTPVNNGFLIKCGSLEYEVANNSSSIFRQLNDYRKVYTDKNFEGPYLKDKDGNAYKLKIGEWKVVEAGPVTASVEAECSNIAVGNIENKNIKAVIKVTGYAGKPWVNITYRIINTSDDELKIKSLVFYIKKSEDSVITEQLKPLKIVAGNDSTGCGDIRTDNSHNDGPVFVTRGTTELDMIEKKADVNNIRTVVATSNYKTSFIIGKNGEEVNEVIDDKYLVKEANEHFAEVFYGTFMADYTDGEDGFSVTVHQAQQNYPKAVKSCSEGVAVMLVPENVGEITMQSGMAKEQQFMIHFHSPAMKLWEIDNRSLIYQMPDRPYIAPEVFKRAGVMIDVFPVKYNDDFEISLMAKADGHSRCYGMLNWGDTVDQGYTVQGRGGGKPVWSNNEYDYPHACALMYARTGVRRFMDYLIVSAKHWMDIDVCHYSSNPLRIGGQWEHTAGHCKNGVMVCSHEWVEGLLDYYHFTGDKRGYDTAVGIGENVLKLLETPMYQVPGEANARETGWALRTLTALYVETNDNKWLVKCDWIIDNFKKWEEEYGDWLSPYTDNTAIRVGFMISIAVGSVMRYYRIFPREDIRQMILRAVDDLTENCYMDNGLFYYKELPSLARNGNNTLLLEALAIAYELTGNKQYLEYGINTFRGAVNEVPKGAVGVKTIIDDAVICQGNSGKGFAQSFIPLATYYNAISENNMTF